MKIYIKRIYKTFIHKSTETNDNLDIIIQLV